VTVIQAQLFVPDNSACTQPILIISWNVNELQSTKESNYDLNKMLLM